MLLALDALAQRQLAAFLMCNRLPVSQAPAVVHDAVITGLCSKWARYDADPAKRISIDDGLRYELLREDTAPAGEPIDVTWSPRADREPARVKAEQLAAAVGCDVRAVYEAAARIGLAKLEPSERRQQIHAARAAKET
jgi:hypothetical protein